MATDDRPLKAVTEETASAVRGALDGHPARLSVREIGIVTHVSKGIAGVSGLPSVRAEELILFPGDVLGLAFNLDPEEVGVVLLGDSEHVGAGAEVRRTHRLLDVPVGEALLGRVVDALGRPLDDHGPLRGTRRRHVEQPAPRMMEREPVSVPLQTGIKAVDALIPIGRGQRELILGDRQTGKTALAIDAIINQKNYGLMCVYCAIGQRTSAVAKVVAYLRESEALRYTAVVVTTGDDPPGLQYVAPYAATSIAEYFVGQGRDVLIVYDDLTRHARSSGRRTSETIAEGAP
jgi:F-type H+-transporting ATPase subunit alpha